MHPQRGAWCAGIVHGDIKPSNAMLTDEGCVKLTDFGLARQRGKTGSSSYGTRAYLSPELYRAHIASLVENIESDAARERERTGASVLGVKAILSRDPLYRPFKNRAPAAAKAAAPPKAAAPTTPRSAPWP